MKTIAIILAGGTGNRMKNKVPKQYIKINNITILRHTINIFLKNLNIEDIVVVINKEHQELYDESCGNINILPYIIGGNTRQQSVYNGLIEVERRKYKPEFVLIHDAARPLIHESEIDNILNLLKSSKYQAVDLLEKVTDTIKIKQNDKLEIQNREQVYNTQTPQGFVFKDILELHQKYINETFTDDISLFLKDRKYNIGIVEGNKNNIKITTKEDLNYARWIMNEKTMLVKVGMGFDVHAFGDEKHSDEECFIMLGGIQVPSHRKIIAHSDGDVILHALTDAILGGIGEDDIGVHFPPSNPKFKGADSSLFVKSAISMLQKKKGYISNIDITFIGEKPHLKNYKDLIRNNIAKMINISKDMINIKATTTEKMGFTGRGEGIAAQAVCTLYI